MLSIGAGSRRFSIICDTLTEFPCSTSREATRSICGRSRVATFGEARSLRYRGTPPDRSRYALAIDVEWPLIWHHNLGVERNVTRQCEQTAVAVIRSWVVWKKVGTRPRISGGRWFIGGKVFFRRFAFNKILAKSEAYLSIYTGNAKLLDYPRRGRCSQTSSCKMPE